MNLSLTAQQFFDGTHLHGPRVVEVDPDGVVVSIREHHGSSQYELMAPGFVDLQMNGYQAWDVADGSADTLKSLDEALFKAGTTSWLGTIVTAPLEKMSLTLERLTTNVGSSPGCIGFHVEGPFLGGMPGAHNPKHIIPADLNWIMALPSEVQLVTIAAENSNVLNAVRALREQGIIVSIGHSQATQTELDLALSEGASMVTHLFNGMSGVHHRDAGVALEALTNDNIFAGLIVDLVHVQPRAVSLAFRSKSSERICLVSDSIAWEAHWAQKNNIVVSDGAPRLPNGTLAGSSTPLAECVRNAVLSCGVSLEDALKSATSTPATLIQNDSIGRITEGEPADIVALDSSLRVVKTLRRLDLSRA